MIGRTAALLCALLCACRSAHDWPSETARPPSSVEEATPEPRAAPSARRASGPIEVRLARYAEQARIEVLGGIRGPVTVERRGKQVSLDGGAPRDELVLEPGTTPLKLGEHAYAGKLRVRADRSARGLEVTNLVDLEDYVAGVVAGELSLWSAELEVLRAQAIASRSYAVAALEERGRKRADPYLFDDVRDQVYEGVLVPNGAREREVATRLKRAIESTRGAVLLEGERVVDARFHAACGGTTADGRVVFPETDHECLQPVECAPCQGRMQAAREASWKWNATPQALDALAKKWKLGAHVTRVTLARSDASGRWLEVEVAGDASSRRTSFEEFRRALGADKLASSAIARTWPRAGDPISAGMSFEGRGRGHGVGLCQYGARGYAAAGWNAERILAHYYPGARVADFR